MDAIALVLFLPVVLYLVFIEGRKKRIAQAFNFNPPNAHGGARFAINEDLKKAGLLRGKGIPIGYSPDGRRALHYPGKGHLLTIAAARTGKGTTLLVNALMSWRHSCLVFDPKGELCAITAHFRKRFGAVLVVNPFEMFPDAFKGLTNARFNPMDILDTQSSAFHVQCNKLATGIVLDEPHALHFSGRARTLVSGVIAALKRHGKPSEQNLPTVARVINGDIIAFCRLTVQQTSDPYIVDKLGSFADADPASHEVQDVIATARGSLAWLTNAAIEHCLSGSDFRFFDLKKHRGTTVFIVLPLNMLDVSSEFLRELLETALADLLHEGQHGNTECVLAIIDELFQVGPHMKSLENAMGMAAGAASLQIWGILQDASQLIGMYPKTWQTFIQNAGVTLWFGARDETTREYVSKLSGITEVISRSRSVSFDHRGEPQVNYSMTQMGRPLLLPHEVGQLNQQTEMIAFVEGVRCGPIKARRRPYWKVFAGGYRKNPYVQSKSLMEWLFG